MRQLFHPESQWPLFPLHCNQLPDCHPPSCCLGMRSDSLSCPSYWIRRPTWKNSTRSYSEWTCTITCVCQHTPSLIHIPLSTPLSHSFPLSLIPSLTPSLTPFLLPSLPPSLSYPLVPLCRVFNYEYAKPAWQERPRTKVDEKKVNPLDKMWPHDL